MYLLCIICLITVKHSAAYTACDPDSRCLNNRACTFGSQQAYNKVADHLFQITGCANCKLDCSGSCVCAVSASQVELAIQDSNTSGLWCNSPLCTHDLTRHALQFVTYNYPCETAFAMAQEQVINLCGTISGQCCNGKCTKHWEIDQPEPRCETYTGHDALVRWLFSAYVIIIVVLWQWSTEMDIDTAIQQNLKT